MGLTDSDRIPGRPREDERMAMRVGNTDDGQAFTNLLSTDTAVALLVYIHVASTSLAYDMYLPLARG